MPNRLANETSAYLRQHADNPVDWYAWGDEALSAAKAQDKPILLSVGYSSCHWCHVMAHESFENQEIAALMNQLFINIKVDREERPDIDTVYMNAVQAMTGHGGWPMTVFLTPAGEPFFGGTYFPPNDGRGLPGFIGVLRGAAQAYREEHDAVLQTVQELRTHLAGDRRAVTALAATAQHLDAAAQGLLDATDMRNGGFGQAPKFPHPAAIDLLLRRYRATGQAELLTAAEVSLGAMANGGIRDHLGGGFHRYSTDASWTVPHFEKMLYDNAQLAPVYLHAYQLTGNPRWRLVAEETLDYLVGQMRPPSGGFAASQDADTVDGEGFFYTWRQAELPDDSGFELAAFEGDRFILRVARSEEPRADVRRSLLAERNLRTAPRRDEKLITSWNALAIQALAECGAALRRPDYLEAAINCAQLVSSEPISHVAGTHADKPVFLEDYAFLADALLTLYSSTGDAKWFNRAAELSEQMLHRFYHKELGFFDTDTNAPGLITRPQTVDDNAIPAGQSKACNALMRLYFYTQDGKWRDVAEKTVSGLAGAISRQPLAFSSLAQSLELMVGDALQVAVVGDASDPLTLELVATVQTGFHPVVALAWGIANAVPLLAGKTLLDGAPAAYVCQQFTCSAPTSSPKTLASNMA